MGSRHGEQPEGLARACNIRVGVSPRRSLTRRLAEAGPTQLSAANTLPTARDCTTSLEVRSLGLAADLRERRSLVSGGGVSVSDRGYPLGILACGTYVVRAGVPLDARIAHGSPG
jgi:hypothetical protein